MKDTQIIPNEGLKQLPSKPVGITMQNLVVSSSQYAETIEEISTESTLYILCEDGSIWYQFEDDLFYLVYNHKEIALVNA